MRLSVVLLLLSLAGILAGGWLTGRLGLGLCVIADSVAVGFWALRLDDGSDRREADAVEPATLHAILERARRAG
jgi:hypothetical protein